VRRAAARLEIAGDRPDISVLSRRKPGKSLIFLERIA